MARRRPRPDRARGRDRADRPGHRPPSLVRPDRGDRGGRRDPAPVPRLARRPRQSRDRRRAPTRRDRAARAARPRPPFDVARDRSRRRHRARDPVERAAAAPPAGRRAIRRVADPAGTTCGRCSAADLGGRGSRGRAVGLTEPGGDRLRDDHDGHARALEGEQPRDVRRPRAGWLDRRRARAAGRSAVAGEGGRDLGRRGKGRRRVRAGVLLPRRGARLLAGRAR